MTDSQDAAFPAFTEHRVQRDRRSLYVRDFPGSGPAFVLLHGFPDNLHIYDDLISHLAAAGRRTVAFDFLGFGASDKPEGALYSFEQQLGDLEAVVEIRKRSCGRAVKCQLTAKPFNTLRHSGATVSLDSTGANQTSSLSRDR